jgi:hypothetical protein
VNSKELGSSFQPCSGTDSGVATHANSDNVIEQSASWNFIQRIYLTLYGHLEFLKKKIRHRALDLVE